MSQVGAGVSGDVDQTEFIYNATTGLHDTTRYWTGVQYYDASYEYDVAGRLTHIKDWINATDGLKYEYDALGRPTKFTEYTGNNTELTYTYDAAGRIATMTDYFSDAYSYTWTARGELASITRGTYVWEFAYNALGQRTQYTHPNGVRTEYEYDNWNRLEGIYHINASTEAVLDSFEYTLNDGNEITRIDSADGSNWRYAYDDRGRLYWAVRYSNGDTLSDWYQYTYDDADNMTQYWRYYVSTQTYDIWDYVYNAANQQTSMTLNSGTAETRTYDDWGRLTARAQGAYSAAYTYRYGDRLRQVTSSFPGETATSPVYEYGGDGKLRRRGSEEIRYGLGFNPVAERTNIIQVKSFVYEPHKQVSERLAYIGLGFDTNKQYYCHDHLGSVRRARSSAKGSLGVWDYEPYGKVHSGTATPLIFALHPYESGMGFFTAPYRNYSSAMARWTTTDPLGMTDGPNVYGYVSGSPVMHFDPYGQCLAPGAIIGGGLGGYAGWKDQANKGCGTGSKILGALSGGIIGGLAGFGGGLGLVVGVVGGGVDTFIRNRSGGWKSFAIGAVTGLISGIYPTALGKLGKYRKLADPSLGRMSPKAAEKALEAAEEAFGGVGAIGTAAYQELGRKLDNYRSRSGGGGGNCIAPW